MFCLEVLNDFDFGRLAESDDLEVKVRLRRPYTLDQLARAVDFLGAQWLKRMLGGLLRGSDGRLRCYYFGRHGGG